MPELPEVETVMLAMKPVITNTVVIKVIQRRQNLRFPIPCGFADNIKDSKIIEVRRRAKYILLSLNCNKTLMIHLGMSGRISLDKNPCSYRDKPFAKHDHLIIETNKAVQIRYNDARRFGFLDLFPTELEAVHPRLKHLGPEPLSTDFNSQTLTSCLKHRKSSIKTVLMNQENLVGVGNIYACESLFQARIDPEKPANALHQKQVEALVEAIKSTLERAIRAGGSTLRDHRQASGELGYFQHEFHVYGRENQPCLFCGHPVLRIVQRQRSTFYCKQCQT